MKDYSIIKFAKIEKKWQKKWEENRIFEAKDDSKKLKYYLLEMYPYPSASGLHMGHAFNYIIGDVLARFKRMQGFNVLHPMGYDSFGLPAENAAIKNKSHPKRFTDDAIDSFIKQQKALGLSYDWSRKLKSHDSAYYRWNQYFFLQFYKKGLVYRKKSPVNWCSECKTVLANEQVHNGKCWRHDNTEVEIRNFEQWFIKTTAYADELLKNIEKLDWPEGIKTMQRNWIGKSEGAEIIFKMNGNSWPVFTTRPDTLFGVTFLVISAQHPKLFDMVSKDKKREVEHFVKKISSTKQEEIDKLDKKGIFTGSYAEHPLTGEKVPVWVGNFVLADYGSGMMMGVPAHDDRDFDFAQKYGIPIKQVVRPSLETKVKFLIRSLVSNWKDKLMVYKFEIYEDEYIEIFVSDDKIKDFIPLGQSLLKDGPYYFSISGKSRLIVFKRDMFDIYNNGNDEKAKDYGKKLSISRNELKWSQAFIDNGILINSEGFDGLESNEAKEHIVIALHEKGLGKKTVNYKLRDWLISRQRYWGTPIPMIYCDSCKKKMEDSALELSFYNQEHFDNLENGSKIMETRALNPNEKDKSFANVKTGDVLKCINKVTGSVIYLEVFSKKIYKSLKELFEDKQALLKIFPDKTVRSLDELEKLYSHTTDYLKRIEKNGIVAWGVKLRIPGIVPVPEKELPVLLPEKVKFGEGNPLATSKEFVEVKCPQCKGKARRETDTMDTFFDSSWYYLRFTDSGNVKEPFKKKKSDYWMPVNFYTGGAEHACMHLIYARFFSKALRDMGYLSYDEPFKRLFNQGMIHGEDGVVMSKSRDNVIDPLVISSKYGTDALRLFLVSMASPDKDSVWSSTGIEGTVKFILKLLSYFKNVKIGKSSKKAEHKLNLAIREIGKEIEDLRYNFAVIYLRALIDYLEDEMSKKDLKSLVKLIVPFCPHIAEELWEKIGGKGFVSVATWPEFDESKIDYKIEEAERAVEKSVDDILNVLRIIKEKKGKEVEKVYIYVIPNEKERYNEEFLRRRVGKEVKVFSVNDKNKYDPEGKAGKTKPGKPGIYAE